MCRCRATTLYPVPASGVACCTRCWAHCGFRVPCHNEPPKIRKAAPESSIATARSRFAPPRKTRISRALDRVDLLKRRHVGAERWGVVADVLAHGEPIPRRDADHLLHA